LRDLKDQSGMLAMGTHDFERVMQSSDVVCAGVIGSWNFVEMFVKGKLAVPCRVVYVYFKRNILVASKVIVNKVLLLHHEVPY
jgi:hypothetical protein